MPPIPIYRPHTWVLREDLDREISGAILELTSPPISILEALESERSIPPDAVRRAWIAIQTFCGLVAAGIERVDVGGGFRGWTEAMSSYAVRVCGVDNKVVNELLAYYEPIPQSPHDEALCAHNDLPTSSESRVQLISCPKCHAHFCCACSVAIMQEAWHPFTVIHSAEHLCPPCRGVQTLSFKDLPRRSAVDGWYQEHAPDILIEYGRLALAHKRGRSWERILADLDDKATESRHAWKPASVVLSSACRQSEWARLQVERGVAFLPRAVKSKLLRDAENVARIRSGLPAIGEGWMSEMAVRREIERVAARFRLAVVSHARHAWLGRQHIDIYLPDLALGFEYMGEQHYAAVEIFGGAAGLAKTITRDRRKRMLCSENAVVLIDIRFDEPDVSGLVMRAIEERRRTQH